jgi:hypothetical protein
MKVHQAGVIYVLRGQYSYSHAVNRKRELHKIREVETQAKSSRRNTRSLSEFPGSRCRICEGTVLCNVTWRSR